MFSWRPTCRARERPGPKLDAPPASFPVTIIQSWALPALRSSRNCCLEEAHHSDRCDDPKVATYASPLLETGFEFKGWCMAPSNSGTCSKIGTAAARVAARSEHAVIACVRMAGGTRVDGVESTRRERWRIAWMVIPLYDKPVTCRMHDRGHSESSGN